MALKRSNLKLDSPVNNFATLNPLVNPSVTLTNGNLQFLGINPNYATTLSTLSLYPGEKWYWEILATDDDSCTGIATESANLTGTAGYLGSDAHGYVYFGHSGQKYHNDSGSSYGPQFGDGDIIGVLYDGINNTLSYYKNGSPLGIAFSSLSTNEKYFIAVSEAAGGGAITTYINFGQDPTFCKRISGGGRYSDANGRGKFYYKPPWGALALCSANLPAAMDETPSQNFKPVLYTGKQQSDWDDSTGSVPVGFQPDFVWVKSRDDDYNHYLYDSIRGAGNALQSSSTNPQEDGRQGFQSFNENGFSVGDQAGENAEGKNYVAWTWKAGGAIEGENNVMINGVGSTMVDSGLDTGDITPTAMSVNTKAGFSIIKWVGNGTNGATVPHGLNQAPDFFMTKLTDNGNNSWEEPWTVYHSALGLNNQNRYRSLVLNNTDAQTPDNTAGIPNAPDSQHFTNVITAYANVLNLNYITYAWHSVPGYSAFGSYEGNNASSGPGPFVNTGFRPAFVMIKNINSSGPPWEIYDSERDPGNGQMNVLVANSGNKEGQPQNVQFLPNGFRIFDTNSWNRNEASTYIYMAFAEKPPTVPEKVKYNTSMKERHSLYFNGSSHLNKTMSSGSKTKFTYSCWLKRSTLMNSGGSDILWYASNGVGYALICFTNNQLRFYDVTNNNTGDDNADIRSSHVFRDQSSFDHVVLSVNASEATLDSKVKIYVNGKLNPLDGSSYFNDIVLSTMNTNISTNIGNQSDAIYMNGNLSNVHFIDGAACSADYFGKYENGKWVAKEYEGGYGNNGFHLDFAPDNMEYRADGTLEIVKDSSGNGNHWTAST